MGVINLSKPSVFGVCYQSQHPNQNFGWCIFCAYGGELQHLPMNKSFYTFINILKLISVVCNSF